MQIARQRRVSLRHGLIQRGDAVIAADPTPGGPRASNPDAARFAKAFATALGLDPLHVQTAYEDPLTWIGKEGQLPDNFDAAELEKLAG